MSAMPRKSHLASMALLAAFSLAHCRPTHLDTLIKNVRLIDGSGTHARDASVRIRDGRILDVGELQPATTTFSLAG